MKAHWFHVLLALAESDLHGHGIMRSAEDASGGEVRLWPVTLYASLDELVAQGWIRELTGPEHPVGESQRRRYFRITQAGRSALRDEAKKLDALSRRAMTASE